jgi:hypothetical protein
MIGRLNAVWAATIVMGTLLVVERNASAGNEVQWQQVVGSGLPKVAAPPLTLGSNNILVGAGALETPGYYYPAYAVGEARHLWRQKGNSGDWEEYTGTGEITNVFEVEGTFGGSNDPWALSSSFDGATNSIFSYSSPSWAGLNFWYEWTSFSLDGGAVYATTSTESCDLIAAPYGNCVMYVSNGGSTVTNVTFSNGMPVGGAQVVYDNQAEAQGYKNGNGIYVLDDNQNVYYSFGTGTNFTTWSINLPYSCYTGESLHLDEIAVNAQAVMGIADNGGAAGDVYTWYPGAACWEPFQDLQLLSVAAPRASANTYWLGFMGSDADGKIYMTVYVPS